MAIFKPKTVPGRVAAVVSAVAVLNVAALAGWSTVVPGLFSFLDHAGPADKGQARHATTNLVARRTGPLPADTVLTAVLSTDPTSFPGSGWHAATSPVGTPGTPFDATCGPSAGLGAVVTKMRGYAQSTGPLPGDLKASLTVSLRAYSAGAGAVAFRDVADQVASCSSVRRVPGAMPAGVGTESMAASTDAASAVLLRRGDVVATITYQVAGHAGDVSALAGLATEYDQRLIAALAGVCVDINSTLADAPRSVVVDHDTFTGRVVGRTVTLPSASPSATAEPSPQVSASVALPPIPAPTVSLPPVGSLPSRPAGSVSPSALPSPVSVPTPPVPPSPAASSKTVNERVADDAGPGCGWAFTGQAAPPFDAKAAQEAFATAQSAAVAALQADQARWEQAKQAYYDAYAAYLAQVQTYQTYVDQVAQVRAAWDQVNAAEAAYEKALSDYDAAVKARDDFLAAQQEAQATYNAAVQACQAPGSPSPSSSPSLSPSASASPTPSPSASPACPPVRPAILTQPAPTVPAAPTPPPAH